MGRHDRWSLLVQVTCMTSVAWLVASGAPSNTVSDSESGVLNGDYVSEVSATRGNSQGHNDLSLLPMPAPIPPVKSPWPASRRNSTERHERPPTGQRNVPEGGLTRKWHFTHISARFVTGRYFRVRASAVSRAVVGAVFIAISLSIAVAMFTCVWCCCRCDRSQGYDEQSDPAMASYSSYPPPLPAQDKVPPSGAYRGSTPQSTDLPPPYDLAALHVVLPAKPVPGMPRPTTYAPGDEQPPAYHAAVASVFRMPEGQL